ncbi:MAG: hypothetical protein QGG36_00610 [Pirellulaceae bacterium]|nr:hypothetical protein [Pirellulaceae bacterium]MDP7014277.1 hypothetical protein [Pirellulaceae bacterium]
MKRCLLTLYSPSTHRLLNVQLSAVRCPLSWAAGDWRRLAGDWQSMAYAIGNFK